MSPDPTRPDSIVPRRNHRGVGQHPARRVMGSFGILGTLVLGACSISPQPVPPPEETLSIQPALISLIDDGAGNVLFRGEPGAVTPGAEVLRAVNRTQPMPPLDVLIAPDGSFDTLVTGTPADAFRAQARKGSSFSLPVDIIGKGDGPIEVIDPVFGSCVSVDPPTEVVFRTTVDTIDIEPIRVRNDCPVDLSINTFVGLGGEMSFEPMLGTFSSSFLPVGGEALLGIAFRPPAEGVFQETMWIEFLTQPPEPEPAAPAPPPWILSVRGVATFD